jgi:hypothetical protein
MPFRLPKLRVHMSVGKTDGPEHGIKIHKLSVRVKKGPGQTDEDRAAMMSEIEAVLDRDTSGWDPEAAHAAVEEIVRRHGATIERFEED